MAPQHPLTSPEPKYQPVPSPGTGVPTGGVGNSQWSGCTPGAWAHRAAGLPSSASPTGTPAGIVAPDSPQASQCPPTAQQLPLVSVTGPQPRACSCHTSPFPLALMHGVTAHRPPAPEGSRIGCPRLACLEDAWWSRRLQCPHPTLPELRRPAPPPGPRPAPGPLPAPSAYLELIGLDVAAPVRVVFPPGLRTGKPCCLQSPHGAPPSALCCWGPRPAVLSSGVTQ